MEGEVVKEANRFNVYLGAMDTGSAFWDNPNAQKLGVTKVIPHPRYINAKFDNGYDIALLYLAEPAKASPTIETAKLPPSNIKWETGTKCRIAGWGGLGNGTTAKYAQEIEILVSDMADCAKRFGMPEETKDGRIVCVEHPTHTQNTCPGDSGGPLVCELNGEYYLAGDTSFGATPCNPKMGATAFTSISYFMEDWIKPTAGLK
jgi:secreted trypsin-like serine protease